MSPVGEWTRTRARNKGQFDWGRSGGQGFQGRDFTTLPWRGWSPAVPVRKARDSFMAATWKNSCYRGNETLMENNPTWRIVCKALQRSKKGEEYIRGKYMYPFHLIIATVREYITVLLRSQAPKAACPGGLGCRLQYVKNSYQPPDHHDCLSLMDPVYWIVHHRIPILMSEHRHQRLLTWLE